MIRVHHQSAGASRSSTSSGRSTPRYVGACSPQILWIRLMRITATVMEIAWLSPAESPVRPTAASRRTVMAGSATTPSRMLEAVIPSWQPVR